MIRCKNHFCFVSGLAGLLLAASSAPAVQFSFLNPAYTQEIYAGPVIPVVGNGVTGIPGAFTASGQLLARQSDGNPPGNTADILEYSLTQNAVHQGTNVHGVVATHTIANLAPGVNMARATDGYLYLPTSIGLQRVDPNTWGPAVTVTSTATQGYSVNTLPNGNVVYAGGSNNQDVYIYNPTTFSNTLVYSASTLIDDIETSSVTGLIALAGQQNNSIILLNSSGSLIQPPIPTTNYPDGLAFAALASPPALYSNDNMGTITRYDFASGYSSPPTATTVIASGGSYGDIACAGNCSFFVTQFFNGGQHGSALFGTHWDNGNTDNEPSIIRIGSKQGCLFDPPVGIPTPEPSAFALMLLGCTMMGRCRRQRA
jgi:hypothetical protein